MGNIRCRLSKHAGSISNGSVSAVHPTETKEACHAIQTLGSPDYPGTGPGPGTRPGVGRLQQQFEFARDHLLVERSGRLLATASSPAASSAAPSSPAAAGGNAKAQITANWEAFFDGQTSAAKKIQLLQNGSKFASLINAQAGSGLASSAGAKVTAVVVNSATSATVSYDITLSGATALPNQTGTAVYQDGIWKVGDVSFCQLLKLENAGSSPSVCSG